MTNVSEAAVYEAARQIAMERKALLNKLRDALLADDQALAISLAKELCGIPQGEPSKGRKTGKVNL